MSRRTASTIERTCSESDSNWTGQGRIVCTSIVSAIDLAPTRGKASGTAPKRHELASRPRRGLPHRFGAALRGPAPSVSERATSGSSRASSRQCNLARKRCVQMPPGVDLRSLDNRGRSDRLQQLVEGVLRRVRWRRFVEKALYSAHLTVKGGSKRTPCRESTGWRHSLRSVSLGDLAPRQKSFVNSTCWWRARLPPTTAQFATRHRMRTIVEHAGQRRFCEAEAAFQLRLKCHSPGELRLGAPFRMHYGCAAPISWYLGHGRQRRSGT